MTLRAYFLGPCLGMALVQMTSKAAMAELSRGVHPCVLSDSAQTLAAESGDLKSRLPPGYRTFEIVPKRNNVLRVVVHEKTADDTQKRAPIDNITDTWATVLAQHHPDCGYSYLAVEFVTRSGAKLLTSNIQR